MRRPAVILFVVYLATIVFAVTATAQQTSKKLQQTNDWLTAVRVVQVAYPGSSWWLTSCSASEGGHGEWVWNGGYPLSQYPSKPSRSSGAGGWGQYMEGTFWTDYRAAVADLRQRGFKIPPGSSSWYSPLGQAIAMGWAYGHSRPHGKWLGGGC